MIFFNKHNIKVKNMSFLCHLNTENYAKVIEAKLKHRARQIESWQIATSKYHQNTVLKCFWRYKKSSYLRKLIFLHSFLKCFIFRFTSFFQLFHDFQFFYWTPQKSIVVNFCFRVLLSECAEERKPINWLFEKGLCGFNSNRPR